jgi:hypothetical protein
VKILIAVPTYGQNDSRFTQTAFLLAKYPGTELGICRRSMPDKARNGLVEQVLKMGGYDFIFFLDDDMVVETPAILASLVAKMEKDKEIEVLATRAYKRTAPYHPCLFTHKKGAEGPFYDSMEGMNVGIVQVDAVHFAATLVRVSVFSKVSRPWFEFLTVEGQQLGEDISFSRKLEAAGVKLHADTDLEVGHISDPTVVNGAIFKSFKSKTQTEKLLTPTKKLILP